MSKFYSLPGENIASRIWGFFRQLKLESLHVSKILILKWKVRIFFYCINIVLLVWNLIATVCIWKFFKRLFLQKKLKEEIFLPENMIIWKGVKASFETFKLLLLMEVKSFLKTNFLIKWSQWIMYRTLKKNFLNKISLENDIFYHK